VAAVKFAPEFLTAAVASTGTAVGTNGSPGHSGRAVGALVGAARFAGTMAGVKVAAGASGVAKASA